MPNIRMRNPNTGQTSQTQTEVPLRNLVAIGCKITGNTTGRRARPPGKKVLKRSSRHGQRGEAKENLATTVEPIPAVTGPICRILIQETRNRLSDSMTMIDRRYARREVIMKCVSRMSAMEVSGVTVKTLGKDKKDVFCMPMISSATVKNYSFALPADLRQIC